MNSVTSKDGTRIAFEQAGRGPHLVLVHGTSASRGRWAPVRRRLEEHFTVSAMDRRGRGDSGDNPAYAMAREVEDIVALVESLDGPVLLFGHSFGGMCALEAAQRTTSLTGLVLYEPPTFGGTAVAPEQLARLESRLAVGDREGLVAAFMTEVVKMPARELDIFKASPAWPARVAAAHTMPRELRAVDDYRLDAGRIGRIAVPVLLLLGGDSPARVADANAALEEMLPRAKTVVMPGQQHIAMDTAPDLVVDAVIEFWRGLR